MSHHVPEHLPGDLGEHDPRRQEHPDRNLPGAGGHEVKIGREDRESNNSGATAAEHSSNQDPSRDNTAEHALEGGSTETMDRSKRQAHGSIPGHRQGEESGAAATRAGHEQQYNTGRDEYNTGSSGTRGTEFGNTGSSGLRGSEYGNTGSSGLGHSGVGGTGYHGTSSSTREPGYDGAYDNNSSSLGREAIGGLSGRQTGGEPLSGVRGSGVAGEPYDAGNSQRSDLGGYAPQHSHQHHDHGHGHGPHVTRTAELLDPATNRETGIPGYTQGPGAVGGSEYGSTGSGLAGSSHTGSGLTGSSHTGQGLTGSSHTGQGLTGSSHTGSGLTGSEYGQTGSGLTGSSHTGQGLTGSSHTGSGLTGSEYGQTGSGVTGSQYGQTGSGLTGEHSTTGHHSSSSHNDSTVDSKATKPSLLDRLNPMKDTDNDGKKGFMD